MPISARGLCCPCHKQILEQARLVNMAVDPQQALTQWHMEFISCGSITEMLRRGREDRKAGAGDWAVV